jgi:hypothetical protein
MTVSWYPTCPPASLVLETLQEACKTEPDRKCFRLVGGVLVERTVKDVSPQLESQYEQIKALLETLTSQYKTKVRQGLPREGDSCSALIAPFHRDAGSGLCGMAAG